MGQLPKTNTENEDHRRRKIDSDNNSSGYGIVSAATNAYKVISKWFCLVIIAIDYDAKYLLLFFKNSSNDLTIITCFPRTSIQKWFELASEKKDKKNQETLQFSKKTTKKMYDFFCPSI